MFKKVESVLELQRFDEIWTRSWEEKGFELEYSEGKVDRYLIRNDQNDEIGSIEFKAFSHLSEINAIFPFHHVDKIKHSRTTIEVDKVAILNEHRGKNLDRLLSAMVCYGETNRVNYYIALIDPLLYRALRVVYKVPSEKLGEKMFYKGDYVYPVYIDVEFVYRNKDQFSWLKVYERV
ncbi:hypothetical protein A8709_20030 [Paenibacillus pectinilyticus]|uniref:N-acetyltransferase domain-containing protein n=1 Tax=Paenibacillus pectinilyticus TaxID=512399 RepID=A0A1C1A0F9_9BACL|nr:hypothetical protein [Paenibacillus pectinilyticus]OCT13864.1 hypothetical protein A8709_20030 [Paenibacillus pectinilyticus]